METQVFRKLPSVVSISSSYPVVKSGKQNLKQQNQWAANPSRTNPTLQKPPLPSSPKAPAETSPDIVQVRSLASCSALAPEKAPERAAPKGPTSSVRQKTRSITTDQDWGGGRLTPALRNRSHKCASLLPLTVGFVPWDLLVTGRNHRSPKIGKPGGRSPTAGPVVGGSTGLGGGTNLIGGSGGWRPHLPGPAVRQRSHFEGLHLGVVCGIELPLQAIKTKRNVGEKRERGEEKRDELGAVYIVPNPKRKGRPASKAPASTPIVPAISGIKGETPLGTWAHSTTVLLYKVLNLFQ